MGASNSKPGSSTQHVFTSDTPIQFSQELIDSLQASPETNSTRAKTLELHIAQRVASELEKIQKHESETLNNLRQRLSSESPEAVDTSTSQDKSQKSEKSSLFELPSISAKDLLPDAISPGPSEEEKKRKDQSTKKIQGEIEKLKQTLGQRKILKDLPKEVDQARNSVISCLKTNDRRPLDCWKEIETFKKEVRKMEEKFVGDVL